jgi:hypothetical protein
MLGCSSPSGGPCRKNEIGRCLSSLSCQHRPWPPWLLMLLPDFAWPPKSLDPGGSAAPGRFRILLLCSVLILLFAGGFSVSWWCCAVWVWWCRVCIVLRGVVLLPAWYRVCALHCVVFCVFPVCSCGCAGAMLVLGCRAGRGIILARVAFIVFWRRSSLRCCLCRR